MVKAISRKKEASMELPVPYEEEEELREGHRCWDYPVPYEEEDSILGHGWICGKCGELLQVG